MKTATLVVMRKFEVRRVLLNAACLGGIAAIVGELLAGWTAAVAVLMGTTIGALCFLALEWSLRGLGEESTPHALGMFLGSVGRTLCLAVPAVAATMVWGLSGGVGFLTGMFLLKVAMVLEGIRSGAN